jgi:hypothetical protein
MPKNTFLLIAILAVFAALVIGVNIGKKFNTQPNTTELPQISTPTPIATPTPTFSAFTGCGITLVYPKTLTKLDIETGGAMLVNSSDTKQSVAIACQKDIPRPALVTEKIEPMKIGSVSATLYHDASEKDGASIDKLIFRHPKSGQDVYISGFGPSFNEILSTIVVQ